MEWLKSENRHDGLSNPEYDADSTDTTPVIQHTALFTGASKYLLYPWFISGGTLSEQGAHFSSPFLS